MAVVVFFITQNVSNFLMQLFIHPFPLHQLPYLPPPLHPPLLLPLPPRPQPRRHRPSLPTTRPLPSLPSPLVHSTLGWNSFRFSSPVHTFPAPECSFNPDAGWPVILGHSFGSGCGGEIEEKKEEKRRYLPLYTRQSKPILIQARAEDIESVRPTDLNVALYQNRRTVVAFLCIFSFYCHLTLCQEEFWK